MKYFFIAICLISSAVNASTKAVTDEGDIVFLHANGTWEYEAPQQQLEIKTNKTKFLKDPSSNFQLKSKKTDTAIWIDPKKWSFTKAGSNEDAEYEFQLKDEDLYGMIISEGIKIGIESLTELALENAQDSSPNMKITKREYRIVNGEKVIYMEMQGTVKGGDFTFFGYYFSNEHGSTQFLIYTATNLIEKYRNEIDTFLNGFSTAA